jgi:tetratricopeptide (TPR) repeat protein
MKMTDEINKNNSTQKPTNSSEIIPNQVLNADKIIPPSDTEQRMKYWKDKLSLSNEEKKWIELLLESEKCINEFSEWEYGYFERGTANYNLKSYDLSIEDFDKCISLNKSYYLAFSSRAMAKFGKQMIDITNEILNDIVFDFDQAIKLNPLDSKNFSSRAYMKNWSGDRLGALEDYNQAIILNEGNAVYYAYRGLIKEILNDSKGAVEDFIKGENFVSLSNDAEYYFLRSLWKSRKGDYVGSKEDELTAMQFVKK